MAQDLGKSLMTVEKKREYIEKAGPRNTVYNETVRANNKREARGEKTKAFPRGKAGDKIWRGKKRGGSR